MRFSIEVVSKWLLHCLDMHIAGQAMNFMVNLIWDLKKWHRSSEQSSLQLYNIIKFVVYLQIIYLTISRLSNSKYLHRENYGNLLLFIYLLKVHAVLRHRLVLEMGERRPWVLEWHLTGEYAHIHEKTLIPVIYPLELPFILLNYHHGGILSMSNAKICIGETPQSAMFRSPKRIFFSWFELLTCFAWKRFIQGD